MKKIPSFLLVALLIGAVATPPTEAFAKRGSDDSHQENHDNSDRHGRHHDSHDDSDDSYDDSSSATSSLQALEVEADVFTDTTIVKVELVNGKKVVFTTTADTEAEVVDAVVEKLGLVKADVEAALIFEVEDRASRIKERDRISSQSTASSISNLEKQISQLKALIELLISRLER